jgi:phosphoserine phosphatase
MVVANRASPSSARAAAATPPRRELSAAPSSPPPGGKTHEGNDVARAMEMLSKADAVCFDVDSAVVDEEGIDVLAETLGRGPEVAAWTARAMGGDVKFEDALAARLDIIRPSRDDVSSCLERHPLRLTPGVAELAGALSRRGTHVYLVSGGFRLMIEPVARALGVPGERIYANTILFDDDGGYAGFDSTEPTSADGGKPRALAEIKAKYGYRTMVMVGDGATDAQAMPPADAFIGFGGVITREAVRERACWFVRDFRDMIDIVENEQK